MKSTPVTRLLMALLAPCLLVGCQVNRPVAHVLDVRVVEQTDQAARLILRVEVENSNDVPLPLPEMDYELAVEGFGLFVFKDAIAVKALPPQSVQTLELAAAFPSEGRPLRGAGFTARGDVTYWPPGPWRSFLTETGVPLPHFRFRATGVVE